MDSNNEDPWQYQGAKAKALVGAELNAHKYVRRAFKRREEKNEGKKTRFIVQMEGRLKRARAGGAASVGSKRSKSDEIPEPVEKTDKTEKSTENDKPPATEK
jgi:hypothetical protein